MIVNQFGESTGTYQRARSSAWASCCFFLTVIIGVIARGFVARYDRKWARSMSAVTTPPPPAATSVRRQRGGWRRAQDVVASGLIVASLVIAMIPLVFLIIGT